MNIYKRTIIDQIIPYLGDETIVVLHGARQVGKTHILYWLQNYLTDQGKAVVYYDLEYPELLELLNQGSDALVRDLEGRGYSQGTSVFVLIDEIQYLLNPSSFLKIIADHHKYIHLIVSGSSSFDIKSKFTDSLVGRTTSFDIFNLSFAELLTFKQVSITLAKAMTKPLIKKLSALYEEYILYGGYPKIVLQPDVEKKKQILLQIIDTYIRKDIRDLAQIDDITKFNQLLCVLAAQSGQILNKQILAKEAQLSIPTLNKYLSILEETYVIKLVPPFSNSPKVELSKSPKLFFYDSGLQSLLWLKQFQQVILGSILETNVFAELIKLYGKQSLHYWRTKDKLEIDFILNLSNLPEKRIPIEVKVNFNRYMHQAISAFTKKYRLTQWYVTALKGSPKDTHYVFPWQLGQIGKPDCLNPWYL